MRSFTHLAVLILAFGFAFGCGKSEEEKKSSGLLDKAKQAADALKGMAPETMKAEASKLLSNLASKLDGVKDKATVEHFGKEASPWLDKLAQFKTALGGKLDVAAAEAKMKEVVAKFQNDPATKQMLEQLMAKLNALGQ